MSPDREAAERAELSAYLGRFFSDLRDNLMRLAGVVGLDPTTFDVAADAQKFDRIAALLREPPAGGEVVAWRQRFVTPSGPQPWAYIDGPVRPNPVCPSSMSYRIEVQPLGVIGEDNAVAAVRGDALMRLRTKVKGWCYGTADLSEGIAFSVVLTEIDRLLGGEP